MEKKIFTIDKQKWTEGGYDAPFKMFVSFLGIMLLQGVIAIVTDFVLSLYVKDIAMSRPTGILVILMVVYGVVMMVSAVFWSVGLNQELRCFVQMNEKLYMVRHSRNSVAHPFVLGVGVGAIFDVKGHKMAGDIVEGAGAAVSAWKLSRIIKNMQSPLWIGKTIDEMMQGGGGPLEIRELIDPVILSSSDDGIVIKSGGKKIKINDVYSGELFSLLKGGSANA